MAILLLLLAGVAFGKSVYRDPMINKGLFEGDIAGIDPNADRNAIPLDSQRWIRGEIPYVISPELHHMKDLILSAMKHIEQNSCIHFKERVFERDYIRIYKDNGCFSYWGRTGGQQPVSLGDGCENFAVIVHELLHAIGFEHEHNRSDRDDYLIINWDNIEPEFYDAFKKLRPDENRLLTSFDFGSMMLYGSRSFAKDYYSDDYSMVTRDGRYIEEIYERKSMSVSDSHRLRMLYNC